MTLPTTALQLRSTVQPDATLTVHLETVPVLAPGPDEVLIQVQATPINPSDIGLLFGAGNLAALTVAGTADRPVVTAPIPERAMPAMAARLGQSLPVGNEGAGLVVAAGDVLTTLHLAVNLQTGLDADVLLVLFGE